MAPGHPTAPIQPSKCEDFEFFSEESEVFTSDMTFLQAKKQKLKQKDPPPPPTAHLTF